MKKVYLIIINILFSSYISAQIKFEHITVEHGLPHNNICSITQDSFGFLWISTTNGLVKYDGYSFTTYLPEADNPNSIGDRNISEVLEDRSGNLWIGTFNEGLNKFNPEDENFKRYLSSLKPNLLKKS